jgi:hypothetical protein
VALSTGQVCSASAELIGGITVGPELGGRYTKGVLRRWISQVKSTLHHLDVNGNEIVRPEC